MTIDRIVVLGPCRWVGQLLRVFRDAGTLNFYTIFIVFKVGRNIYNVLCGSHESTLLGPSDHEPLPASVNAFLYAHGSNFLT